MTAPSAPPPLDVLLAHRDWVRRFARTLARDDASAADLEQDAWLTAVERTPSRADRPAGWLRRVLTRRAMDVARGERRRAAHEAAAARPERVGASGASGVADVGDVVAAAEMHRRVVEEVVALDEPYRTTVLLRFFEDLPPREVAVRMGAPVETVRSRVRTAVETLRARLDERHGGARAAWIGPLLAGGDFVPGGGSPGAGAAGGSAHDAARRSGGGGAPPGRTSGGLGPWIGAGVGVVLAAAVGIALLRTLDDGSASPPGSDSAAGGDATAHSGAPRRPHPRALADGDVEGGATPGGDVPAAPAPEDGAVRAGAPAERDFVVTVLDVGGGRVAGVRVVLDPERTPDEPSGVTDSEGRAALRVAGPVRSARVDVEAPDGRAWALHGSRADGLLRVVPVAPAADACTLVVEARSWIRGVVRTEDGAPCPGEQVRALAASVPVATAVADRQGRFALAVRSGGTFDVVVTGFRREPWNDVRRNSPRGRVLSGAQWWAPADGEVRGVPAGATGVEVVRARPADERVDLAVRVVGEDGTPVAGIVVRGDVGIVLGEDSPVAAPTDPEGRTLLRRLPRRRVSLYVRAFDAPVRPWESGGWAAPRVAPFVRSDEGEVTLVLPRGDPVRGRVEIPDEFFPVRPDGSRDRALQTPGVQVEVRSALDGEVIGGGRVEPGVPFSILVAASPDEPLETTAAALDAHGNEWTATPVEVRAGGDSVVLRLVKALAEDFTLPAGDAPAGSAPPDGVRVGGAPALAPK